MLKYIDADTTATTVRMMRRGSKNTIILVEGESDFNFYSSFIDCNYCNLLIANGKGNAIDAVEILDRDNFKQALAIVDADFWNLEGIKPKSPNILLTDTHDIETMIFRTDIFQKLILEFFDSDKTKNFREPIMDLLLNNALIIGYFKWINSPHKEDLRLDFKDIAYEHFIDFRTFKVNLNKLIEEVKINSNNYAINEAEIKSKILELMTGDSDVWQVCSGHDIANLISVGLNKIFGFGRDGYFTKDKIEKILRISYSNSHFAATHLCSEINKWELENKPLRVVKK